MTFTFLLLMMAGVTVIFLKPFLGLAVITALMPQSVLQAVGGVFFGIFTLATPIKLLGAFTFIAAFIRHFFTRKSWSFLFKPQAKCYLLFLIWLIIMAFAKPGFASRENITSFISFAALGFIIMALLNDIKRFRIILWISIISVLIVSLSTLARFGHFQQMFRARGAAYGPNEFAIGLLPFIGIAFYNAFAEKKKSLKFLSLAAAFIITFALIATHSRGGLAGLFGMLLITSLRTKKRVRAFFISMILLFVISYFVPSSVWERIAQTKIVEEGTYTGQEAIDSSTRRFLLARAAWKMYLDNPIFGHGPGNYYYDCRNYEPLIAGRAHNMYLEIMAELGTFGIALFMGILFFTYRSIRRLVKAAKPISSYAWGLSSGLTGFLVAAIFLHAQQEKVLWFAVFMVVALEGIKRRQEIAEK